MNSDSDHSAAEWITVQDAARILRRSPRSVHSYAEAGQLQVKAVGRRHLFLRAEVEALAARLPADDTPVEQAVEVSAATLAPMMSALHAEIDDLRQRLAQLEGMSLGTQILVGGVEAELARRADWPTELELRASLVQVTAERDWLLSRAAARHRWWSVAGAVLVIAGVLILLAVMLALVWHVAVG